MAPYPAAAVAFFEKLNVLCTEQRVFSERTFKPDAERGPVGALRHLSKEAKEAADQLFLDGHKPGTRASDAVLVEFADCFLLLLDATRRAGFNLEHVIDAAAAKLKVNETREWPAPNDDDTPIEHVRVELKLKLPDVSETLAEVGKGVNAAARASLEDALKRYRTGAIITVPEAVELTVAEPVERHMTTEMLVACLGLDLFAQLNQMDVLKLQSAASKDAAETAEWLPYYKAALIAQTNVSADMLNFAVALADYHRRVAEGADADELADARTDLASFAEGPAAMLRASCMLCGLGPNGNDAAARHRCETESGNAVSSLVERVKAALPAA